MSFLRERREEKGWTRIVLAQRTGIPYRTLVKLEGGKVAPKPETAVKLADGLGLTYTEVRVGMDPHLQQEAARQTRSDDRSGVVVDMRGGKRIGKERHRALP